MRKNILFIIYFIFIIGLVSATSLSISPSRFSLNMYVGEKICKDIFIDSDNGSIVIGDDVWSISKSNFLNDYNISSDSFDIDILYPHEISITERTKVKICIIAKDRGEYYGALLYKIKDKPLRAGTWIELNVDGRSINKITGDSIIIKDEKHGNLLLYTSIILGVLLVSMLFRLRQKKSFLKTMDISG